MSWKWSIISVVVVLAGVGLFIWSPWSSGRDEDVGQEPARPEPAVRDFAPYDVQSTPDCLVSRTRTRDTVVEVYTVTAASEPSFVVSEPGVGSDMRTRDTLGVGPIPSRSAHSSLTATAEDIARELGRRVDEISQAHGELGERVTGLEEGQAMILEKLDALAAPPSPGSASSSPPSGGASGSTSPPPSSGSPSSGGASSGSPAPSGSGSTPPAGASPATSGSAPSGTAPAVPPSGGASSAPPPSTPAPAGSPPSGSGGTAS